MDGQYIYQIYYLVSQLAERIVEIWDKCNKDLPEKDALAVKYRAVLLFRKQLREVGGDVIDCCGSLIKEFFATDLYDFAKDLVNEEDEYEYPSPVWKSLVDRIHGDIDAFVVFERAKEKDWANFQKIMKAFPDIENYPDEDFYLALEKIGPDKMYRDYVWYINSYSSFPLKVILRLSRN